MQTRVAVHAKHELGGGESDAGIQRAGLPAVLLANDAHRGITVVAGQLARTVERPVARAVVYDDDMEDRITQLQQAAQCRDDDSFLVEDRDDDRNRWLMRALFIATAVLDVLEIAEP